MNTATFSTPPFSYDEEEFRTLAETRLHRHEPDIRTPTSTSSRAAAVLVPLITGDDQLKVLLTRRSDTMTNHPGQIAFPGGKIDPDDDGPLAAALRETEEETGIRQKFVEPCGFLDMYETGSGYRICPIIGLVRPGYVLRPEAGEVAEIFEIPLKFLMNPANHQRRSSVWGGRERRFYAIPYEQYDIWGATAGMLRNFHDIVFAPGPEKNHRKTHRQTP